MVLKSTDSRAPFVVLVGLTVLVAAPAGAWKLLAEKAGTRIEHQKDEQGRTELRVSGRITAPCADAEAVLRDIQSYDQWMPGVHVWRRIPDARGREIYYSRIEFPFPFSDRDYVVRYDKRAGPQGVAITAQSVRAGPEPTASAVRMTDVFSQWTTERDDAPGCLVRYWERSAIGGMVPDWMVEKSFAEEAAGLLFALEERAQSHHQTRPGVAR